MFNKTLITMFFLLNGCICLAQCPDGYTSVGTERAVNGDFDSGNSGFTSQYTNVDNNTSINTELQPEAYYSVWNNPRDLHANFAINTNIAGTGNIMVINGSPTANQYVWRQTISVDQNTFYYFVTDVASVHPTSPAQLQFSVNGVLLGSIFNASATTLQWNTFYATWSSGSNSSAIISIVNQNTAATGNDFALDKISFIPCTTTLPIELLEFKVNQKDCNELIVSWQTATETNNDFFTIERSDDGKTFLPYKKIYSKNSNSKSTLDYSIIDSSISKGICYYRLKQTDFDGKSSYSKILSIQNCVVENDLCLSIFPNPSYSKVNVNYSGNKENIESINLFNVYGENIYESSTFQNELKFENLNSGMYIFRILLKDNKTIEKVFIVK